MDVAQTAPAAAAEPMALHGPTGALPPPARAYDEAPARPPTPVGEGSAARYPFWNS